MLSTTALVVLLGAAAMLTFEPAVEVNRVQELRRCALVDRNVDYDYGTDIWPRTSEGRLLCFLLAPWLCNVRLHYGEFPVLLRWPRRRVQ